MPPFYTRPIPRPCNRQRSVPSRFRRKTSQSQLRVSLRSPFRLALWTLPALLLIVTAGPLGASPGNTDDLISKYEEFLLFRASDYEEIPAAKAALEGNLLGRFRRAVRFAGSFAYGRRGELAYYANGPVTDSPAGEPTDGESDGEFHRLFNQTALTLAYAYHTPGAADVENPYYQNPDVLRRYLSVLDYAYSRGLTENAWLPDHAGNASLDALERGLVRTSGDFSDISLRLGGYIQSVFLMRGPLAGAGLLDKYRAVVRNLVVNCGTMYGAFFLVARAEAGIAYPNPLPVERQYHLNADGMRLFVDYFWPYYLLVEDADERSTMAAILYQVIDTNIAAKPGVYGTFKPDGTGFHHGAAYIGAYTPFTLEASAQLLYLAKGTTFYRSENVETVKTALEVYRVMMQKYSISGALRGRLIGGSGEGVSRAVSKAMAFLAHADGFDDMEMKARFAEFFDEGHFLGEELQAPYFEGSRGLFIRGLGIYRLIAGLQRAAVEASEPPNGVWIRPYAVAGFFRRGDWLVTAKGFSQYFWDYEGNLDARQNSFGQNWAYGSLIVFSSGNPISEQGSGLALADGWDWYHIPGTTASHYMPETHSERALRASRREQGIRQRTVHRNYNSRTFVGGVSLGDHGLFVQDLEAVPFTAPTDLRGWKSYFFVGEQVLALGSHIRGGTDADATHTTIFQTRLESPDTVTTVNNELLTGLDTSLEHPPGPAVKMTDSVGNSFFLETSTAGLVVSRSLQQSMSEDYEPTEGAFATAYLNHGIKPEGDSYRYVLIPADADMTSLELVAADPSAYYQVIDETNMHLVHFPQQRITAYAFYEAIETPEDQLVRFVNQPATVLVERQEPEEEVAQTAEQTPDGAEGHFRLVASVPDIGWQFDSGIWAEGLPYAMRNFAFQRAREHTLRMLLRGTWCPDESTAPPGAEWISLFGQTLLQLPCRDGLGTEILLRACEAPTAGSETDIQ